MRTHVLICLFTAAAGAAFAQTKQTAAPLADVITLRADMTAAIVKGDEKPDKALARLQAHPSPSGLQVDRDADFALAAIDVGLRLLGADRAANAEQFFQAAEKALVKAIQKTKDEAAQEKALYLQQLSFIRANFLNEVEAASDDLDAALKLQPDDRHLQDRKKNLTRDKAEQLKNKPKN